MMDLSRTVELMQTEKECIKRSGSCSRDCARCDLVQDPGELLEAYNSVLAALETVRKWEDDRK